MIGRRIGGMLPASAVGSGQQAVGRTRDLKEAAVKSALPARIVAEGQTRKYYRPLR